MAYFLPWWSPRQPFSVNGVLQDDDCGDLVDHRASPLPVSTLLSQYSFRTHRSQPFVHEPNRHRVATSAKRVAEGFGIGGHLGGCRAQPAAQGTRKPDDDLDGVILGREVGEPVEVSDTALHGLDRCRDQAVRIASGDSDPDVADVNAEPDSGSKPQPTVGGLRDVAQASSTDCAMASCMSSSASGAAAAFVPPPWARSSLPPPFPPSRVAATRTS